MKEVKDKGCITRATREKQLVTKRKLPEESQLTFQGNTASQKGWICYILYRKKIYKQEYPTWQGYYSDLKKEIEFHRQKKKNAKSSALLKWHYEKC